MMHRLLAMFPMFFLVIATSASYAAPDSPHLAHHRQLMGEFTKMLKADPAGAKKFAQSAVEATRRTGPFDPKRGDALELLSRAYIAEQDWKSALPVAAEVLVIRRAARPPDPEILSMALLNDVVVLFGAGKEAEADAALTEVMDIWRQAFGKQDLRLAEKLEMFATDAQYGMGRGMWMVELLREAVEIRDKHPPSLQLAFTLNNLALQEMTLQDAGTADAHLERAAVLFEKELAKKRDDEELWASLVGVYVARAGIAAKLGNQAQALKYMAAARVHRFKDRVTRADMGILIATGRSEVLQYGGDIDAAINAHADALEILNQSQDLLDSGALDNMLAYDVLFTAAQLYLAKPDLELAGLAIDTARKRAGRDTAELLFLQAELAQANGRAADAMKHYQAALRMTRESAGEASVLYGTNRQPSRGAAQGNFGGGMSAELSLGRAEVLVPGAGYSQKSLLAPSRAEAMAFGQATDPTKLFIRDRRPLTKAEFAGAASAMVRRAKLYPDSALVFVHGFNVSFDAALQRAAQLRRDLNYDSALFVFSWPSKGSVFQYDDDRHTADAAVKSLVEFLTEVERATGARKIHLIAHSMGNRVALPALVTIAGQPSGALAAKIGEVILAAPAVPQAEFVRWIDRIAAGGINHLTLYASRSDKAMWGGLYQEKAILAGYSPFGLLVRHSPVQSVDLTRAGLPGLLALNHDVFASNPVMTEDIRQLLSQSPRKTPNERLPLFKCRDGEPGKLRYWVYDPVTDAPDSCRARN